MQTVWSRVAQAQSICNCSSCISATNALSRRVTTFTSRRRIRVGNVFTVLSSSVAATAALVDSRKKDSRRKHWDRIISKARAEVEEVDCQHEKRLESLSHLAEQGNTNEESIVDLKVNQDPPPIRLLGRTPWFQAPDIRSDTWGNVFEWASKEKHVRVASGFQDYRGFPLDLLQKLSSEQVEELLNDRVTLGRYYGGPDVLTVEEDPSQQSFSNRKFRTLEWSIAQMAWRLFLHSANNRTATLDRPAVDLSRSKTDTTLEGKSLDEQSGLGQLCSKGAHVPQMSDPLYDCDQDVLHNEERVHGLTPDKADIHRMIGNATEHLRSLQRLNEHEAEFHDLESPRFPRYGRVQEPSEEALDRAGLRQYLRSLLRNMSPSDDPRPFLAKICHHLLLCPTPPSIHTYNMLLSKFCELQNEALVLVVWDSMRNSHIRPNEATYSQLLHFFTVVDNQNQFQKLLRRMKGLDGGVAVAQPESISPFAMQRLRIRDKSTKVVEKARMNDKIYESLIIGALKFMGQQSAMHYYRDMIREGWDINLNILHGILQDCCRKADWEGGLATWYQIVQVAEKATQWTYYWMLRLCQICGKYDVFHQVLQEGADRDVLPAPMLRLHVKIGTLDHGVTVDNMNRLLRSALDCCIDMKAFLRSGVEAEPPASARCFPEFIKALRENERKVDYDTFMSPEEVQQLMGIQKNWNDLRKGSQRLVNIWKKLLRKYNHSHRVAQEVVKLQNTWNHLHHASQRLFIYWENLNKTNSEHRVLCQRPENEWTYNRTRTRLQGCLIKPKMSTKGQRKAQPKDDVIAQASVGTQEVHEDLEEEQLPFSDHDVPSPVIAEHEQRSPPAEAQPIQPTRSKDNNPQATPLLLLPPTVTMTRSLQIHDIWDNAPRPMIASA
ncbi:hypothetical protein N7G274_002944 [Stereocaulon virgatum]|uniref:Uncharacterized protein n=1 Tax=Stereocaulon virgatum TaxID=373712 RepID=A0ABR4AHQ1_9LECA